MELIHELPKQKSQTIVTWTVAASLMLLGGTAVAFAGPATSSKISNATPGVAIVQQNAKTITGKVTDKNGEPIVGATVRVTGGGERWNSYRYRW